MHKNRFKQTLKTFFFFVILLCNINHIYDYFLMFFISQDAIFRVVAAILHLGNVDFAKGKEIDSSIPKDDKSKFHLNMVAELLM